MRDDQDAMEYHNYYRYHGFSPRYGVRPAQREREGNILSGTDNLREFPSNSRF